MAVKKARPRPKHTYIIEKRVLAHSIEEAIRSERAGRITQVYADKQSADDLPSAIGFRIS